MCYTHVRGHPLCLNILVVNLGILEENIQWLLAPKRLENRQLCHLLIKVYLFMLLYQNQKDSNVKLYDNMEHY